ncbi:MAG: prepilin-type N-terminal cleavage/methylation domain-containing protein [Hydrogenophilus sp.]|nr:prepilin-type N-terminal cleavage/methylation domain-containing protein [Hydrogenophilus sp.]
MVGIAMRWREKGFSLIEAIVVVVVLAVGLTALLRVVTPSSSETHADPLIRKQMVAIAESLLEEVMVRSFTAVPGPTLGNPHCGVRAQFNDVFDFNGYDTDLCSPMGYPLPDGSNAGLGEYRARITVNNDSWGNPAVNGARVVVRINHARGGEVVLVGYRAG